MNRQKPKTPNFSLGLVPSLTLAAICIAVAATTRSGLVFTSSPERLGSQETKNIENYPEGDGEGSNRANNAQIQPDIADKVRLLNNYGKMPLQFEANRGQSDNKVRFLSQGPGYGLLLTPTEAVLSLHKTKADHRMAGKLLNREMPAPADRGTEKADPGRIPQVTTLRMKLVGGNPATKISGLDKLPGKVNYFRGKDPRQWRSDIPTYAKTRYEKVYPGIDLIFYGNQQQLEYDFVVAPGADPKAVSLSFDGAEKVAIDTQGDLVLGTLGGEVRWHKPTAYQTVDGLRRKVDVRFVVNESSRSIDNKHPHEKKIKRPQIGFQVASYDAAKTLVIDPVLAYSSYLGGNDFDSGFGVAVDSNGNAYVTGITYSTNFPAVNAEYPKIAASADVFVTKFNAAGSNLLYSTYLGGDGWERGAAIAVTTDGSAYITGETQSTDFPVVSAKFPFLEGVEDAFITKLNATGSQLIFSTYLGGTDSDAGNGIAVDSSGNAYVTGITYSSDFPLANAFDSSFGGGGDAFVTKFNATGSQVFYSTYLGGNGGDFGYDIAVNSSGLAYITGITSSANFPTLNALDSTLSDIGDEQSFGDVFVTKFDATGKQLLYSTYLGGAYLDFGGGIAVDSSGNAYITGGTESADFPTANAVYPDYIGGERDAFVSKLNASGSQLMYSTYLGGSLDITGWDSGFDIAVNSNGNAYVTGNTESTDFPVVNALFPELSGFNDVFVTKFSTSGTTVLFSTYLGGGEDGLDRSGGLALDSSGNAYVTGSTSATDFPTHAGHSGIVSYDPSANGGDDAFLAKIDFTPVGGNQVPIANAGADQTVNAGSLVILNGGASYDPDNGPSPLTYSWVQTGGPSVKLTAVSTAQPSFTPLSAGTYVFKLVVHDGDASSVADSVTVTVNDAAYFLIQEPNGGDVWNEKSKQTISWSSHQIDSTNRIVIYLSIDHGGSWKKIASAKNVGTKTWKIPKKRFVTKDALIKICVKPNETLCDVSDSVFTINKAPVADAGVKQIAIVGNQVVLDGSSSYDPDNGPSAMTYQWTQKSGLPVALNDADKPSPSFTALNKGNYKFGLTVNDGAADSTPDKVTVIVKDAP